MDKLLRVQRIMRETFPSIREWREDMPTTLYGCLGLAMLYRARLQDSPLHHVVVLACKNIRAIIEEDNCTL